MLIDLSLLLTTTDVPDCPDKVKELSVPLKDIVLIKSLIRKTEIPDPGGPGSPDGPTGPAIPIPTSPFGPCGPGSPDPGGPWIPLSIDIIETVFVKLSVILTVEDLMSSVSSV
jgi:hypothetical protein